MKNKLIGKTLQVLEFVSSSPEPASMKAVAAEFGLAAGTLSRIISDLCEYGLIEKFGYHHVRPSLGMIRLGQDAMMNSSLPRIVPPLIRSHAEALEAKGAFAGVHRLKLVYLYNSGNTVPGALGLPYWEPVLRSRMAAAILGTAYTADELDTLIGSGLGIASDHPDMVFFHDNCRQVRANGYIAHREQGRGWSVNFPVVCNNKVYGVALSGKDTELHSLDRMIFETSLLASRLTSALDETR